MVRVLKVRSAGCLSSNSCRTTIGSVLFSWYGRSIKCSPTSGRPPLSSPPIRCAGQAAFGWAVVCLLFAARIEGMSNLNRVQSGIPEGGQFSESTKARPSIEDLGGFYDSFTEAGQPDLSIDGFDGPEAPLRHIASDSESLAGKDLPGKHPDNPNAIDLPGYVHPRTRSAFFDAQWASDSGEDRQAAAEHLKSRLPSLSDDERQKVLDRYLFAVNNSEPGEDGEVIAQAVEDNDTEMGILNTSRAPFTPAGADTVDNRYGYQSPAMYGNKYNKTMSTTEAAKAIRADIKEATATGYLPSDLTYSVRKSSASALSIEAQGLTDDQIYAPVDDMEPAYVGMRQRPEAVELQARIDSISNSYRMDESDSMTDYFETNFYAFSRIEDEDSARFRQGEKERLEANRLARWGK